MCCIGNGLVLYAVKMLVTDAEIIDSVYVYMHRMHSVIIHSIHPLYRTTLRLSGGFVFILIWDCTLESLNIVE